jgi:hypothetical protein
MNARGNMINYINSRFRRRVLIFAVALLVCAPLEAQNHPAEVVKVQVDPKTTISRISEDFIGLGYETSAAAQANYFSPKNDTLVRLYRNLSPHGLIRIGGIISDHTEYAPDGVAAARTQTEVTVINQSNLADLGNFARAAGWKVMWGLNLGTGSKQEAVREATAVNAALGSQLQSFQIGNEVEALQRFARSYDAYYAAFCDYRSGIREALPDAPFSGPDSIGNWVWVTNFVAKEARNIKLLTHHYYRGGAKDPRTTLERLLQHDEGWENRLEKLRDLCGASDIRFRINEVNSFSGGGKPGVSDTFGAALWCLDYMFLAATYGCAGVNMETDVNQLGFISHYSPIVHDSAGLCRARPEYYGMLAFAMAGKGDLLKATLEKADINLTAYATRDKDGFIWITMVNKDFTRDAAVEVALPERYSSAVSFRLEAPSMESKDQVTLAGAEVSSEGYWDPKPPEPVATADRAARCRLPHASAILLRLRPN